MQIVEYGLTVPLLLVMWFVVLVTGSMPPALYPAYAALLRYQVRLHSWFGMLDVGVPLGHAGRPGPAGSVLRRPSPPSSRPPRRRPARTSVPGPAARPGRRTPTRHAVTAGPRTRHAQPFSYPPASDAPDQAPSPEEPAAPPPDAPGWPPPMPPPMAPAHATAAPPGGLGRHAAAVAVGADRGDAAPGGELPPWGMLVLEGAARGWMIFAIVWGSVVFVGPERRPDVRQRASAPQPRRGPALRRGPPR